MFKTVKLSAWPWLPRSAYANNIGNEANTGRCYYEKFSELFDMSNFPFSM